MASENLCKSQFQSNKFDVRNVSIEKFYTFQWWHCRITFAIYRAVVLAWTLGWIIHFWANMSVMDNYTHLTNWTELYIFIYYVFAFVVAVYGAVTKNRTSPSKPGFIRIFQGATWAFQTISFGCAFFVFIVFWALLSSDLPMSYIRSARNIYTHGLIMGVFILDFFLVAIPVRLFHAVYAFLGFLIYSLLMIIWQVKWSAAIYNLTDFETNLPTAIGMIVGLTVIGPLISQTILFFLYWLKTLCTKNEIGSSSSSSDVAAGNNVHENVHAVEMDEPKANVKQIP